MSSRHVHWLRRSAAFIAVAGGATVALALASGTAGADGAKPASGNPSSQVSTVTADPLDVLSYSIRTRYDSGNGAGCTGARTFPATIGVPKAVDVGGQPLADLLVTVVALPGVGGGPDVLELAVANLQPIAPLKARVEVVITPDSALPARVSAGADGCESGLPAIFSATIGSSDDQLALLATTLGPRASLTVLGSSFDVAGTPQASSTEVSARLAPVPAMVKANIDIAGPTSYRAKVTTTQPTTLKLGYTDKSGPASTTAVATVDKFPGHLDLTFTDEKIKYVASAAMNRVTLDLVQVGPDAGTGVVRTSRMNVDLTGVPETATLRRHTPSHLTFTAPARIGTTVLTFADYVPAPGLTVPVLTPTAGQYLVAEIGPDHTFATAKVLGLKKADIDADDPVLVDVEHTAGPFHVVAKVVDEHAESVRLTLDVLDLPATAKLTYSPASQAFSYHGSADIDELTADVVTSAPLIRNAHQSHVRILSFPTGLTGRLDTQAKTFNAALTSDGDAAPGAIGVLEASVTSGLDLRLPEGQQGLLLTDHRILNAINTYDMFVRVLGLEAASLSWGDTLSVDMTHEPGPFDLDVSLKSKVHGSTEPSPDIEIDGTITDLPRVAYVSFGPAVELPPQAPEDGIPGGPIGSPDQEGPADPWDPFDHVGDLDIDLTDDPGDPWDGHLDASQSPDIQPGTSFVYRGSAPISRVKIDVVSDEALFDDATEAHVDIQGLPKELTLTILAQSRQAAVATRHGPVRGIDIQLCSTGACDPASSQSPDHTDPNLRDGVFVEDLFDGYHATLRLTGLKRLELGWGRVIGVRLLHEPRSFDIDLTEDRTTGEFGQIEFQSTTKVVVDQVPADARLTYDSVSQHVTYTGSAPIASIDARRKIGTGWDTVNNTAVVVGPGIVGRANWAHLALTGLPTGLDLTFAHSTSGEKLVIDAGNETVGHIALDLLSDTAILGFHQFASEPIIAGTHDGLLFWDLDDFVEPAADPVKDPFAIAVRVTNLQRFVSELKVPATTGGTIKDRRFEVTRTGSSLPDLAVELLLADQAEQAKGLELGPYDLLGPHPKFYRFAGVTVDYEKPPNHFGFRFVHTQASAGGTQFDVDYYGSAQGRRLVFRTTAGAALKDLTVDASPVPGGGNSLASPGIDACFSPDSLWCHDAWEQPDAHSSEVSMVARVAEPVLIDVDATLTNGNLITTTLNIERSLIVTKERRVDPVDDNTFILIDTGGYEVFGNFKFFEGGDRDMSVHIPEGFWAQERFVELLKPNVGTTAGNINCPLGFTVAEDWGINIEGRICND